MLLNIFFLHLYNNYVRKEIFKKLNNVDIRKICTYRMEIVHSRTLLCIDARDFIFHTWGDGKDSERERERERER